MIEKTKQFYEDVVAEMKKVSWPTKEQLRESTMVVIVVSAIITAFVFGVDQIMNFAIELIF
ncbi:MAG: preprotein translocase subunit SecE [Chloroflexota bacterium]